ncbi:fatty acid desaturase [Pseudomonas vranovensis]|uniref:fatty acid desaturase n=1 Tax=Pseudomonas vranovensis TaxID=321661 RepID=UPI003D954284
MNPVPQHGARVDCEDEFRRLMTRPRFAWPTIILFVVIMLAFILSTALAVSDRLAMGWAFVINTLCSYLAYTVLHEASHGLICANRFANDVIGRLGFLLVTLTPFLRTYRFLHMAHHHHTNDPRLDPDYSCGGGRAWTLPLRWLMMDSAYITTYFRNGSYQSRPTAEKVEFWLAWLFAVAVVVTVCLMGWIVPFLVLYLLPTRVAQFFLAITFDYLPHFPHATKAHDNKYQATNNRVGMDWLFFPLFVGQNYHLSHHIYPGAPFYRYKKVWLSRKTRHEAQAPALVPGHRLAPIKQPLSLAE